MAGAEIVTAVARIPAVGGTTAAPGTAPTSQAGLRALADPALLDAAAASLGGPGAVEAIGYASTTTAYVIGHTAERALMAGLADQCALPVLGTSAAAVTALGVLGVDRVELVHPPWFDDEMHQLGATYFRDVGLDVLASRSAELPEDPRRIDPEEVVAWVVQHVSDRAQAVFLGGNGFRVAAAIEQLEAALGRPVLTANQVLLWAVLGALGAGISVDVTGGGSLFDRHPPACGS